MDVPERGRPETMTTFPGRVSLFLANGFLGMSGLSILGVCRIQFFEQLILQGF